MKMKYYVSIAFLAFCGLLHGQAPQGFKYQAVARDGDNQPYAETELQVRFTLLQQGVPGTIAYQERHNNVMTTDLGVFALNVGEGTPLIGSFSAIEWGAHSFFLRVDISIDNGLSFLPLGISQLLSVPYALYAARSGSPDEDNDPTNELQTLSLQGDTIILSNGGGLVVLPSGGVADNWGTQSVTTTGDFTGNGTPGSPLGIAPGSINSGDIQDGSINSGDIQNGSINAADLAPGTIPTYTGGTGIQINGTTVNNTGDLSPTNELQTLSQQGDTILLSNGGGLVILPSGGVADNWGTQSVTTTGDFTGNGTSGSPLGIAPGSINSGDIQDGSINAGDLAPGTIPTYTGGTGIQINGTTINNTGDLSPTNELQTLSQQGDTILLSNGGGLVVLPSGGVADNWGTQSVTTTGDFTGNGTPGSPLGIAPGSINSGDIQDGSINAGDLAPGTIPTYTGGTGIQINGTTVNNTGDLSPTNELQTLSQQGDTILLSNGGGLVILPSGGVADNWGTQSVTTTGDFTGNGTPGSPLGIAPGSINSGDIQDGSINAADLAPGTIPTYTGGTGIQINGTTVNNTGDLSPTNELQTLSQQGDTILLSNGGGLVILPSGGVADNWGTQSVTTTGDFTGNGTPGSPLGIAPGSINSGAIQDGSINAADLAPGTIPTYTGGTGIQINGTTVNNTGDLSPTNELQTLSLQGDTILLSNGGGLVVLPSGGVADNWGTQSVTTTGDFTGNGTSGSPLGIAPGSINSGDIEDGSINAGDLAPGVVSNLWAASGGQIYNTNSGNVGIGTTTPQAPLHIQQPGVSSEALRIDGTNPWIGLRQTGGGVYDGYIQQVTDRFEIGTRPGSNIGLRFSPHLSPAMVISPDGRVGISAQTSVPGSAKLFVGGSGNSGIQVRLDNVNTGTSGLTIGLVNPANGATGNPVGLNSQVIPSGMTVNGSANIEGKGIGGVFYGGDKGIIAKRFINSNSTFGLANNFTQFYGDTTLAMSGLFESNSSLGMLNINNGDGHNVPSILNLGGGQTFFVNRFVSMGMASINRSTSADFSIGLLGRSESPGNYEVKTKIGLIGEAQDFSFVESFVGEIGNEDFFFDAIGVKNIGVYGLANGFYSDGGLSTFGVGVYGHCAGDGYAGYFAGDTYAERMSIGTTEVSERLAVNGNIRSNGLIYTIRNSGEVFRGGNDFSIEDIDLANFIGIRGQQNPTVGGVRLGNTGGYLFGHSGGISINTTTLNGQNNANALRVVQDDDYGIALSRANGSTWDFSVFGGGDGLNLYFNNTFKGYFDTPSGNYIPASDRRFKHSVEVLPSVLEKLARLRPVSYRFVENDNGHRYLGFIAQEVLEVFPEVVHELPLRPGQAKNGEPYYGINYNEMSVIAVRAAQDLVETISQQQNEISELKTDLETLRNENAALQVKVSEIDALRAEVAQIKAMLLEKK